MGTGRERGSAGSGCAVEVDRGMSGHQGISERFQPMRWSERRHEIAEMQKWAREAYLSTKHVEDIEDIWTRYFEAEHHLHLDPSASATEPDGS